MLKYANILFDDAVITPDGIWSKIYTYCAEKHSVNAMILDDAGYGVCGVAGCINDADYYIDFPESEATLC